MDRETEPNWILVPRRTLRTKIPRRLVEPVAQRLYDLAEAQGGTSSPSVSVDATMGYFRRYVRSLGGPPVQVGGFRIARRPVSVHEYLRVFKAIDTMGVLELPIEERSFLHELEVEGAEPDTPVLGVTFWAASIYAALVGERLPTEAELLCALRRPRTFDDIEVELAGEETGRARTTWCGCEGLMFACGHWTATPGDVGRALVDGTTRQAVIFGGELPFPHLVSGGGGTRRIGRGAKRFAPRYEGVGFRLAGSA